ncbi:MAG: DUF1178 family protein [Hyphomonadaceae bacterium]
MIRYALICADCEAEFEAWFAGSAAYDALAKAGQLECSHCGGSRVSKQIMAPSVARKKPEIASGPKPADVIAAAREHIAQTHDYVGERFPDEVRAMHYGEIDDRPVWGTATADEAKTMADEGIEAVPLPKALAPKPPKKQLN